MAVKPSSRAASKQKWSRPVDHLTITATTGGEFVSPLRRLIPRAKNLLPHPPLEVSIALVGDKRMAQLHEQFMDLPGPTDVLTFPLEFDFRGRCTSGEIVICVPYARREARARGIDPQKEVILYALHGMLHLCGMDDRTESGFNAMHRMEDQILTRLGLGAVYWPIEPFTHPPPHRSRAKQGRRGPRSRKETR